MTDTNTNTEKITNSFGKKRPLFRKDTKDTTETSTVK